MLSTPFTPLTLAIRRSLPLPILLRDSEASSLLHHHRLAPTAGSLKMGPKVLFLFEVFPFYLFSLNMIMMHPNRCK
ncbi:protein of unknown function [Paenibacillus alvei]|uniref:Uncharacterized protein n=1 Tax=Paenibacillus alvei TaxID=44250 RepID=A0A383R6B3_PAEAL|nr:protein of unknown function [Paenibacillus alvei]